MKYLIIIFSIAFLLLGCKSGKPKATPKKTKQPNQNFVSLNKEFNSTEYPVFKIKFPQVWENYPSSHTDVLLSLRDPEEITEAATFYTNLYIGNMQFNPTTEEELRMIYLNDFSSYFDDLTVLATGTQTVNGNQYVWIEFNYTWQGINIKGIEYWIENQDNSGESTIISAKTLAVRYNYYKPIFLDMVESFEIEF